MASLRIPLHNIMEHSDDVWWTVAPLPVALIALVELSIVYIRPER